MILPQLLLGFVIIVMTMLVHAALFGQTAHWINHLYPVVLRQAGTIGLNGLLIMGVLFVLLALTVDVWIWTGVLLYVDALTKLEEAMYFALVSFTTLGFGDIILEREWRILSGLIAANGLIAFGWSTAFMVELVRRLRGAP